MVRGLDQPNPWLLTAVGDVPRRDGWGFGRQALLTMLAGTIPAEAL